MNDARLLAKKKEAGGAAQDQEGRCHADSRLAPGPLCPTADTRQAMSIALGRGTHRYATAAVRVHILGSSIAFTYQV